MWWVFWKVLAKNKWFKVSSLTSYLVCLRTTIMGANLVLWTFENSCVKCLYTCPLPVVRLFLWKWENRTICSFIPPPSTPLKPKNYMNYIATQCAFACHYNIWQMGAPNLWNFLSVMGRFYKWLCLICQIVSLRKLIESDVGFFFKIEKYQGEFERDEILCL